MNTTTITTAQITELLADANKLHGIDAFPVFWESELTDMGASVDDDYVFLLDGSHLEWDERQREWIHQA